MYTVILSGCFNELLSCCVPFLQVPNNTLLFVEILWLIKMHWFSQWAILQTICVRKAIHVARELYWSLYQNFLWMLGALLCACLGWFYPLPSSGFLAFPDALGIPRYCYVSITGLYCFSATLRIWNIKSEYLMVQHSMNLCSAYLNLNPEFCATSYLLTLFCVTSTSRHYFSYRVW